LVAFTKSCVELTTLDALVATFAVWAAVGFAGSALTALANASTEDLMALVWLGKSLLASLTTALASVWIFISCAFKPLTPLLGLKLASALTEF
jgi:hypothetical protein